MPDLTPEEILKQHSLAMASVNFINTEKPIDMTDAEWNYILQKHRDFLKTMIIKLD